MKRHFLPVWILTVWLASGCFVVMDAQSNITMPYNSGVTAIVLSPPLDCSYLFTDNNGTDQVYSAGSGMGSVITFWPSAPGNKVVVQFITFHTEPGFDALFVYDGPDLAAPQISSGAPVLLGAPHPFSGGTGGWQGAAAPYNIAPNTVRATTSNTSGALTFAFDSDLTIEKGGWTALVSEVPGNVCSVQPPGAIAVTAPAGACEMNVQTQAPIVTPGACSLALELVYRLNDGPAVAVPVPAPPLITIPDVPVGLNVITWQLTAPCGGGIAASAAQLVTVNDVTPPTIVAPPNVTLNLGPGQCSAPYNYTVEAFDNCPFAQENRVDHPINFDNGAAGVMFDVKNTGSDPIVITQFGPVLEPGTWPVEVYVTESAASWQGSQNTLSDWKLAGTRIATSTGADAGVPLTDFQIALAPGESRGVYLTSTTGAPVRCTGTGAGVQRQRDDGVLEVSSAPGAAKGYPFGATFQSRVYNGFVKYTATRIHPVQAAGLPSDAEFPVGVTTNVFQCTDKSGNAATATFSVTVQPFANAAATLVCASMVNVSLGPDCETTLGADDVLLGGPYRCFESYEVELDKIPSYNDGPWLPAGLNSADIGKTYGVRVTDPVNNNFCMGSVLVEDKIPPSLVCKTVDLPCNFNTTPAFSAPASMTREFAPANGMLPAQVSDFQTLLLDILADMPADAVVEDVNVNIRIEGDVFEKNIRIELESPSGVTVVLWDRATGCSGPLWVWFDDEGAAGNACDQFENNLRVKIPFGTGALAVFEGETVNGAWKLRIRDLNGFGDIAHVKEVRLQVRYKAAFSAGFPNGLLYPGQLTQISSSSFVAPAPLLDGCSDVTLSYSDETTTQPCSTGLTAVILRTWTARDASNNAATCVQNIRLLRPGLDDVVLPPDFNEADEPAFECGNAYPTPAWIETQGKQGRPNVFGQNSGCSINWSYTDAKVDVCPGSYTIHRTWLIVDACSAQSRQATQLIQVLDSEGPAINCPANLTVSTDLYNCCATVNLPDAVVEDACATIHQLNAKVVVFNQYSGDTVQVLNVNGALTTFPGNNLADLDTLAAFGATSCLPVGAHHVYYKVEDACGNTKTCSYQLVVRDYTAPVAQGHSLTVVSLNADDLLDCYEPGADGAHFAGVTTVAASALDQGSYDNCSFIRLTVRRVPPYSACIEALNHENGGPPCQDGFPDQKSEYARATGESDSIKFYCCEAGTTQTVALRCYQLDGLGNYSLGANGLPVFNEALIQVEVQDKLSPGCSAPPDLTVSCENFDPTLQNYGLPERIDNCCLDTTKIYHNQPGVSHSADYSLFDSLCDRGTLLRTFKVYDCQGQTSVCTQKIEVTQHLDYAIRFPDDVIVNYCDSSGIYGEPVFHGQACELLAVSFTDEIFTVVSDGCYEIERTWRVKDVCNALSGAGCVIVPNPTPLATLGAPQNLPGPVVSPPGTPAPWNATVTKITPADAQPTDYSSFWNPTVNCYEYKQIIKVIDKQEPAVENSPDTTVIIKDQTLNVNDLWNENYWYDNDIGSHNLGEGPSALTVTATDLCSGPDINVRFLLFLDLDGNGDVETVVNSADLPGFNNIQFGNALNPNFTGGESRAFDERAVPQDQKYGFALQTAITGAKKTATVCWNTQVQPDDYLTPELPYGRHKIRWIISDGCGNEIFREYDFEVKDAKAPTVVCLNGLSVNIMATDMIQMWATDFLHYAEDNHTPPTISTMTPNLLRYAIRKVGTGTSFPVDSLGNPVTNVVFTCDELGPQQVELWAMDMAGNAGYCVTTVDVQDNGNFCSTTNDPNYVTVAGTLKTTLDEGIENAGIDLQAALPGGGTPVALYDATDDQGYYEFLNAVPLYSNYTVTPAKDDNPLNGVSTYDLVLISKHILGQEPFDTPYKMIAADANKSNSITTFDIVEIRKLILGIYSELPGNASWRFVDADYAFPVPNNPWTVQFPETISLADVQANQLNDDFIGIKIGDVNNTVIPNSLITMDDRSGGTLFFDVDDHEIEAGEVFTATFKGAGRVLGYQFTMNLSGLEVVDVVPGAGMSPDNFGVFDGTVTTSVDGEANEFALSFRAVKTGRLSEMLSVSSRLTRAEAYSGIKSHHGHNGNDCNDLLDIAFRFNAPGNTVVSGVGFELYQNQPNPFVQRTLIGFHLPEAAEATLSIHDGTGRLLFIRKGQFVKGYNAIPVGETFPDAGLLYYTLKTDAYSDTGKMVRLR
ncbi:MAG: hypothetical protein EPGJADBJ_03355 [Saprospiraceae bacterium]|nr:hypothetical protein [Saprospiraceae bacterium]